MSHFEHWEEYSICLLIGIQESVLKHNSEADNRFYLTTFVPFEFHTKKGLLQAEAERWKVQNYMEDVWTEIHYTEEDMVLMYRKPGVGQRRHIMPSRLKNNIHYSLPDIKVRNSEFSILIGLAQQKKRLLLLLDQQGLGMILKLK